MQKNPQEKRDINESKLKEEKNKKNEIKDFKDKQQIFMNQINPLSNAIFFNQPPLNKNCFNKFQGKKIKFFAERTGDWICNSCKNLNFAFRVVCNRCQLPKPKDPEKKEIITNEKKNNVDANNRQHRFQNKNKYKYKKNFQYYNDSKSNISKNENDK